MRPRFSTQLSPVARNAARIPLPRCEATCDQIIRDIIEGFADRTRLALLQKEKCHAQD